jgi:hypothetical protein
MGKLLSGLGQLIIGLNFLFTSILVASKYGLLWGILSFAAVPIGAIAAPFFVGTGFFVILGAVLYFLGLFFSNAGARFSANSDSGGDQIIKKSRSSEVPPEISGTATASPMFEGEEIKGPGKLFGYEDGSLLWLGDNGISFRIGDSFESWESHNGVMKVRIFIS